MDLNTVPIRVQIVCWDVLQAEFVVQGIREAFRVEAAYTRKKDALRLPVGGMVLQRADLRRYWDVRVGDRIGVDRRDLVVVR